MTKWWLPVSSLGTVQAVDLSQHSIARIVFFFLQPRKEEIRSPNLHSLAVSAYPPQTYATYTSGIFQKTDIDVENPHHL